MIFSVALLIVMCAASASRWAAYRERVLPPRRYAVGSLRWWFPPFPLEGEFATERSHRLEVTGRIVMNVGAGLMMAHALADMLR